jgi:hypothetical protein
MTPTLESPATAHFRAFGGPLGAIAQLGERLVRNEEVGGSIPPGSTSLRRCAATTGKPAIYHRTIRGGDIAQRRRLPGEARLGEDGLGAALTKYVYLLESVSHPEQSYADG